MFQLDQYFNGNTLHEVKGMSTDASFHRILQERRWERINDEHADE